MHAWKPGTVTCFYPIYYPDFSAFCSIQPLYYKLPSGKLLDQITKSFCLLSPANDIYFYFETLPTARSVGRKALGVGITRHILESAAGTEMWRSLIWKLQWQFLSVPKNKRWGGRASTGQRRCSGEPKPDHWGRQGSDLHSKRGAVSLDQPAMSPLITGPIKYDGEEGSAGITVWGEWWGHTYPRGPTMTGKREWLVWEAGLFMLSNLRLPSCAWKGSHIPHLVTKESHFGTVEAVMCRRKLQMEQKAFQATNVGMIFQPGHLSYWMAYKRYVFSHISALGSSDGPGKGSYQQNSGQRLSRLTQTFQLLYKHYFTEVAYKSPVSHWVKLHSKKLKHHLFYLSRLSSDNRKDKTKQVTFHHCYSCKQLCTVL